MYSNNLPDRMLFVLGDLLFTRKNKMPFQEIKKTSIENE